MLFLHADFHCPSALGGHVVALMLLPMWWPCWSLTAGGQLTALLARGVVMFLQIILSLFSLLSGSLRPYWLEALLCF